jgi:hypothetical protein
MKATRQRNRGQKRGRKDRGQGHIFSQPCSWECLVRKGETIERRKSREEKEGREKKKSKGWVGG